MKSEDDWGLRSGVPIRLWSNTGATTLPNWHMRRWNEQPIALQRLIISSICGILVFALTAMWLDVRIQRAQLKEVAQSSAWFVDDHIRPILKDIKPHRRLPDETKQRLSGLISKSMLGHKLQEMRIWSVDRNVLFSTNDDEIGIGLRPAPELDGALAGNTTYELLDRDDPGSPPKWQDGHWMLEVFYPVRAPDSGRVIAVAELYLDGAEFVGEVQSARWQGWSVAALLSAAIFAVVFGAAWCGSNVIGSRHKVLTRQVREAEHRNVEASEQLLRHIGADLHDGPAQLLSIALLRLGEFSTAVSSEAGGVKRRQLQSVDAARRMTQDALTELRQIAKGLVLPQLENLHTADAVRMAVQNHKQRTLTEVGLELSLPDKDLPLPIKTCLYRCIQEGLNNAFRHAGGREQFVSVLAVRDKINLTIKDAGPGISGADPTRQIDTLGLPGLRNRVEALGGTFSIVSSARAGTAINVELPVQCLT